MLIHTTVYNRIPQREKKENRGEKTYMKSKIVLLLWNTVWQFLKKSNVELTFGPPILLLCVNPRKLKTHVHTKSCTQMCIAVLVIILQKKNLKVYISC